MNKTALYRIGAISLIVGAVLVACSNLVAPQGGVRAAVANAGYYPVALLNFIGGLILMAAWPVAYLYQRKESGRKGLVGFAIVDLFGMALTIGFPTILLLVYPWLASLNISNQELNSGPMIFNFFFAISSGLASIGGVIFGIATVRAKVFSRQLGISFAVLAILGTILGFLSLPGGGGIHMSWWWGTTGTFGVLAFMIGMAWFGVELLQKTRR